MRLWSIHPSYLDTKGLVALWREGLLAKSCLEKISRGEKGGYINHPQLDRFKKYGMGVVMINDYLSRVRDEADSRGMKFNIDKIIYCRKGDELYKLPVMEGQMFYEYKHLQKKLWIRDRSRHNEHWYSYIPKTNDIFYTVVGGIEERERI